MIRKSDLFFSLFLIFIFLPFLLSNDLLKLYETLNSHHPLFLSFIKFSVLATAGECLGLRIKTGKYNAPGFGILPKAIVWGLLGVTIQTAFTVFSSGVPIFLNKTFGMAQALNFGNPQLNSSLSWIEKITIAFSISVILNLIYAPVLMTLHKITDLHIQNNGGKIKSLLKKIQFSNILRSINWEIQWNFVFKKTIPFFWIPAHTITFLLPPQYRVLFAAILGIVLGVLLAVASKK